MTDREIKQIDEMIESYRRTIKFIRGQILDLERMKIPEPKISNNLNLNVIKKENKNEAD